MRGTGILTVPSSSVVIESDLSGLETEWKRLFDEAGRPNPFHSWEWHQSWAETQVHRIRPVVIVERFPDGRFAGLLPLQEVRHRGLRQCELLSQGSGADELDCLLHPHASPGAAHRLIERALALSWQVCRWESMSPASHLVSALQDESNHRPLTAAFEAGEELPYLPLPLDFGDLLAQHSVNFRSEIRRRRRNLERHAGPVELRSALQSEEVALAVNILFDLHNRRRQQKMDTGIFEDESLRRFHRHVAMRLARQRLARIYVLHVAGEPVAALYGFEARQRFYYFQSGWNPDWSRLSPGTVLLSMIIEDCIARGIRQFEFLRGTEGYKSRWTDHARSTVNLMAARGFIAQTYLKSRNLWRRMILGDATSRIVHSSKFVTPLENTLHPHGMEHKSHPRAASGKSKSAS